MFQNREQAGKLLADKLQKKKLQGAIVLGIPRGGVILAKEIAKEHNLPLDIIVVRKIGAPLSPELAIGAVGPENIVYFDKDLLSKLKINKSIMNNELRIKIKEQRDRERLFRIKRKTLRFEGKTVILVDDGVATGATIFAAVAWLRTQRPKKIIVATPVIAADTLKKLEEKVGEVVYLSSPNEFSSVGQFYEEFPQVEDEEVITILGSFS